MFSWLNIPVVHLGILFFVILNLDDRKVFDSVRAAGRTAGVYVQGLGCDDAVHALEGQFGRDEFLHWHGQDDGVDAGRQRKRACARVTACQRHVVRGTRGLERQLGTGQVGLQAVRQQGLPALTGRGAGWTSTVADYR